MATVITSPPSISGIHISAPVRAVVDPAVFELELEAALELELEFVFVLLFELEFDCADATLANDSVMTTARSTPASIRRAICPVMCTLSPSPRSASVGEPEFVTVAPKSCSDGTGPATRRSP
jgi:hypothetical protein